MDVLHPKRDDKIGGGVLDVTRVKSFFLDREIV